ncbi:hypothetical protein VTL71DRAFT_14838 [Oculimacula yallundae]|uniref:Uncharacterized protein n=1 Tax=Oculimacula yallundae TaxID=86028 RepID=A0ABR4CEW2_9HELO
MRLTISLLLVLLRFSIPVVAASGKAKYNLGFIFEYEDWAQQDNEGLLSDVKSTLTSISTIDEVVVNRRIEFASSIFRGLSANISGVGSDITPDFIKNTLQGLAAVKVVTPIEVAYLRTQTGRRNNVMDDDRLLNLHSRALKNGNEESQIAVAPIALSTHIMCGVDKLHAEATKGKGIKIAIMDDGYDYKQEVFGNFIGPGNKVIYGYDWVGDNYMTVDSATGVSGPPVEGKDPYSDCSFHGSHVFGIVGANPTKFGIVGTAPEASYELHRVVGCAGSVGSDVFMKAAIGIYERGVDIMTSTIGFYLSYPDSALSVVSSRINQNGTYFQFSAGNQGSQIYSAQTPAAGLDVTAVGAVFNTETPFYTWGGTYTTKGKTTPFRVGVSDSMNFPSAFKVWAASSQESDPINTGCLPFPTGLQLPDFNTTVVLINQPLGNACNIYDAERNLATAGVRYIIFYPFAKEGPVSGPTYTYGFAGINAITEISANEGASLFAAYQQDKSLTVSIETLSTHNANVTSLDNNISGGRMAGYSSWGPTADGRTYPTFSAPGGQILSIFPRKLGGFGIDSGTSMASPFTAGVAALLKSRHPHWHALKIRNVLATTGNPMPYNDNSSTVYNFLAPVFQQGGGLVDAYRAVHTSTIVDTPGLSFNDTTHSPFQPKTLSFRVKNIGAKAQTFKAYHIGAVSGHGIGSDPYSTAFKAELIQGFVPSYAGVAISPSLFTIAPGSEYTIRVTVTSLPAGLDPKRLPFYGGYISLNSTTDATQSVTVPYTGIATDLKASGIDLSESTLQSCTSTGSTYGPLPAHQPPVFNVTYQGPGKGFTGSTIPCTRYVIKAAPVVHTFDISLVKPSGEVFLTLYSGNNNYYLGDQYWTIDGTDGNYTFMPAGEYQFRVRALKIYGDTNNENDWVSHVGENGVITPSITLGMEGNWRVKRELQSPGDADSSNYGNQRSTAQRLPAWSRSSQRSAPIILVESSSRDGMRIPLSNTDVDQAIEEGRRLYVGNLPYEATVNDIESLFATFRSNGQRDFASIESSRRWNTLESPVALNIAASEGRRLYIGRLPRFKHQPEAHDEIRQLFKGYNIQTISKPISAHESTKDFPGNHNYIFVDLGSAEEAKIAAQKIDRFYKWGGNLKVSISKGISGKLAERRRLFVGGLPRFPDQETTDLNIRELFDGFDIFRLVVSRFQKARGRAASAS